MRAALLVALALLSAACGGPATSQSATLGTEPPAPTRICDFGPDDAEDPLVSCTEAIGKVLLALGPEARSVRAAWFRRGAPCPPNARCMAPPPRSAYVVVRLEGARIAIFRVATEGGEVLIGEREEPAFEVWPPSGQVAPPVGRPDMGPAAPPEVAGRDAVPLCGEEQLGVTESRLERSCFLGAVRDGRPAEFVSRSVDDQGDPFVELYRFGGRGPVLVYRSASFAGPGWVRNDCAIGPAFDDAAIFVVDECLSTELS